MERLPAHTMDLPTAWPTIVALARPTFASSLHFAIASVNADGTPHVTPIGSLLLCPDAPTAIYFELFTTQLARNLLARPRVCVLAVRSDRWFWLSGLLRGRFRSPPAVRLLGTAGPRRAATAAEISRWQQRIARVRRLAGARILWGDLRYVREIAFDAYEPIRLGRMTHGLWDEPSGRHATRGDRR